MNSAWRRAVAAYAPAYTSQALIAWISDGIGSRTGEIAAVEAVVGAIQVGVREAGVEGDGPVEVG